MSDEYVPGRSPKVHPAETNEEATRLATLAGMKASGQPWQDNAAAYPTGELLEYTHPDLPTDADALTPDEVLRAAEGGVDGRALTPETPQDDGTPVDRGAQVSAGPENPKPEPEGADPTTADLSADYDEDAVGEDESDDDDVLAADRVAHLVDEDDDEDSDEDSDEDAADEAVSEPEPDVDDPVDPVVPDNAKTAEKPAQVASEKKGKG